MDGGSYRIDAERWLTIAEKLIAARDFQGAKTFAIRARESDPRLLEFADQIVAVADTIIAGESTIVNYNGVGGLDYYAILQLPRLSQSLELIATQYRKLALLLNPTRNRLTFADHAFSLVTEAWMVFSNPSKKAMYDNELQVSQLGQLGQIGQFGQMAVPGHEYTQGQTSQAPNRSNRIQSPVTAADPIRPVAQHKAAEPIRPVVQTRSADLARPQIQGKPTEPIRSTVHPTVAAEPVRQNQTESNPAAQRSQSTRPAQLAEPVAAESKIPSFWTSCPYCFILYEYPKGYEDCAIRCQKCKRAFHAAVIPTPPINGKDTYFCSWSYFPLGYSGDGKGGGGFGHSWSPISPLFAAPMPGKGKPKKAYPSKRAAEKVIYDDEVYVDLSDLSGDEESDSDDDWDDRRKKAKNSKGKSTPSKSVKASQNERSRKMSLQNGTSGGNVQEGSSGKKRGAKDMGKLDLNVMFSNEVDDGAPGVRGRSGAGNGEEEGFFEGLDEFLSSLPILSVVGDDKVKAS